MSDIYDVAVIGGGPAGYVAAIRASQLGGKVVLFERDELGGTCLNRGCVPTKTIVKTGGCIRNLHQAQQRGVVFSSPVTVSVDMKKVTEYKNGVVNKLTGGVLALLRSNKVDVVRGDARLAKGKKILCADKAYEAKNIILCGGSRIHRVDIPITGLPKLLYSDDMLNIDYVPEKLFIIGAGIIGCEFAFPFAHFGSKVTIIDTAERVTPMLDRDLSEGIAQGLKSLGVEIITGKSVDKIAERGGKNYVSVSGTEYEADAVLICAGRDSVIDCLGELSNEIKTENGKVITDLACRTNMEGVYACGDMTTLASLANAAIKMGETAAENAMGGNKFVDLTKVPICIHSEPEAASLGMNEEDARELYGDKLLVGRFQFCNNGMALASGETDGFIKVLAEKTYGEIVGVHILGGYSSELISEAIDIMTAELTVCEAADIIHPHPALSEAFMEACADAIGCSVHLPRKKQNQ